MRNILEKIKSIKEINKSTVTNNKFLLNKEGDLEIYYADTIDCIY